MGPVHQSFQTLALDESEPPIRKKALLKVRVVIGWFISWEMEDFLVLVSHCQESLQ
jgi:hypothetical protein